MAKRGNHHTAITSIRRYYVFKLFIFFVLSATSFVAMTLMFSERATASCDETLVGSFSRAMGACDESIFGTDDTRNNVGKTIWNPVAKAWLSDEQIGLLKMAFEIGNRDGGLPHAQLIQATLLQETIAGQLGRIGHRTAPVGKRSYGVMQVKVTAALDVLAEHRELGNFRTDEELIVRLMTDDEFNIRVASKFMMNLREKTLSDAEALVAYNIGLRAAKRFEEHAEFRYVKSVNRYFEDVVLPFNRKYLGAPESFGASPV